MIFLPLLTGYGTKSGTEGYGGIAMAAGDPANWNEKNPKGTNSARILTFLESAGQWH